jgi:4-hydroxybenzoate polyprenyltransferase
VLTAPLDALVERTRNRPIPRGAVSTNAALLYAASQAALAVACLGWIPRDWTVGAAWALPGAAGWAYYPYAKRHTHFPQVVLGACIAWGAVMGFLATGTDPFDPTVRAANVCLVLANVVWSMVYDTIYAVQDVEDDVKHGIGSLAVRFRGREKALLWRLVGLMTGLLVAVGGCSGLGLGYYAVAVGGSGLSLGSMVANVNLKDKQSCWWWFSVGFWFAGGAIGGGLLADYLMVGFLNSSLF